MAEPPWLTSGNLTRGEGHGPVRSLPLSLLALPPSTLLLAICLPANNLRGQGVSQGEGKL